MRFSGKAAAPLFLALLGVSACSRAPRNSAQVHPSAATPLALGSQGLASLPLDRAPLPYLTLQPRPGVDVLVDHVQAELNVGQQLFLAGQYQAARDKWNLAGDHLLNSGFEIEHDPRLRELFDKLSVAMQTLDSMNAPAEQASEQQENQEEASEIEPSPIEEIAGLSLPPGDPRLAKIAEQELIAVPHDLPLTINDSVLSYLSYFQSRHGRAIVETGLERAGLYREMIRRTLKEEGVPQDLMYLAQAESAFQPQAVSRKGARGIWQFMAYTGEEYGLERTAYVDQRNDPIASTRAAAQHLRDLYAIFGDWYLAMAAYDSGSLNVARAIERTGYADFWELQKRNALPEETRNYVPIILALTLIAKDPARYGIHVDPEKPLQTDIVKPGHSLNLLLAADVTGSNMKTLRMLNPQLLRGVTPDDPSFQLRLPKGDGARFEQTMAKIPSEHWLTWRFHHLEDGETLESIARKYHVTVASIRSVNDFGADDPPSAGEALIIPATAPPPRRLIHYRVRRGDTLEDIASRFGVTTYELRRWNHLRYNHAHVGARLRIILGSPR